MQPIVPVSLGTPSLQDPHLEQMPNEIKMVVIKCLKMSEVSYTEQLSKGMQKVASDNRVWNQIAIQLNITVNPKDAKKDLIENFYSKINKAFEEFADFSGNFDIPKTNFTQKEKYLAILNYMKQNEEVFPDFLSNLFSNPPISGVKQLIEDGVLATENSKIQGLVIIATMVDGNLDLFQFVANKLSMDKNAAYIFTEVDKLIAENGTSKAQFLKILRNISQR